MIRRPPRSTQGVSSAASDVYKRQVSTQSTWEDPEENEYQVQIEPDQTNEPEEILVEPHNDVVPEESQPPDFSRIPQPSPEIAETEAFITCLLYTSPSPRDLSTSRMPSSA
eukprot:TRINITY_DN48469_c0_g1_i1.p3 TRINITY_DN48469_c0_g1~~TRINITY_DN48469_c0_g1_i1.p3  ORF type:complete len:111 (+),score=44.89 TRINITY_DN48469_c0_g1_i1:93-425(+)